jgi:EmrB/QacA subfamily drug resistance transporter
MGPQSENAVGAIVVGMQKQRGRAEGGAMAWIVLAVACAGQFMVVLDVSVVNVALPAVRADLGFDAVGLQWVVTSYALTFGGFLLLGGRFADLYGRKRIFLAGLAVFSASSLAGGLAVTPGMLIAARVVQGLGAACLAPATLTILTTTFAEPAVRTRAMAAWAATGAAGGAIGGLFGGVLTEYLSWRWILLINVPIGAVVMALAIHHIAESRAPGGRRLDVPGAVLVTGGLSAIIYGVVHAQTRGWGDPQTLGSLAGGLVALAVFIGTEAWLAKAPLMPLRLFRSRGISVGITMILLLGASFTPMWYFLSLYMQNVLHYSAVEAGLGFVPHTLGIIAGAQLAPRILHRLGSRPVIAAGAVSAAIGFAWQSQLTPAGDYISGLLGPAILMSGGSGLLFTSIISTVTSGADRSDAGLASGLLSATRQIGGSLGLAVLATLAGRSAQTPQDLTSGYGNAFLVIAAFLVFVLAVTVALPPRRA